MMSFPDIRRQNEQFSKKLNDLSEKNKKDPTSIIQRSLADHHRKTTGNGDIDSEEDLLD